MTQNYDVNDPNKIQGRDDVFLRERSLASLRLGRALDVLSGIDSLRVLNPGSGAGRYARALARERPTWSVVGGDLSPVAIGEADKYGGGPEYWVFDAESMPFEDGSFDAVVFFDLLEHLPHPERFLKECRRVLAPGGMLHFFCPLEAQPGTLYDLFRGDAPIPIHRWKRDHVGHIQRYRDSDVLALVWDSGLEVLDVAYSFHLTGQVHDIVDYWQRERNAGGDGIVPLPIVNALARGVFLVTWRLSYLEDRLYDGRALASGIHVTAVKP